MWKNLQGLRINLPPVCLLTLTALFGPERFAQAAFINQQPQSTNVVVGSNATFTVVAGGTAPLSYRWRFNGTNLTNGGRVSGANTSNLLITAVVPADAGGYRVVVSNSVSSVTSVVATLTVLVPPTISLPPQNQTVVVGSNAVFTVTAGGSGTLFYQWQKNGTNLAEGGRISGTTTETLTISDALGVDAGAYHVVVTNAASAVTSADASLSVTPISGWGHNYYGQATAPAGATNLVAVSAGWQHALALRADGALVAWGWTNYGLAQVPAEATNVVAMKAGVYQNLALRADGTVLAWGKNDAGESTVPANATNVVALAGGYSHSVALRADGTVLAWGDNTFDQLNIPQSATNVVAIEAGLDYTLALKADGSLAAWGYLVSTDIVVPDSATNVTAIAAGGLDCLVLRSDGTLVAWGRNFFGESDIPTNAVNVTDIGAGYLFSLATLLDGSVIGWGDNFYLQSTPPASVTNPLAIYAGDEFGLAWLRDPSTGVSPRFWRQPPNQVFPGGSTLFLYPGINGTPPLRFQWCFNNAPMPGQTNRWLALPNANPTQSGGYCLVVTNDFGAVTSAVAAVTVPAIAFASQPANVTAMMNTDVTLAATVSGTAPLAYRWQKDGQDLSDTNRVSGSTSPTLAIANVIPSDAGSYRLIVTNSYASVTSDVVVLTVLFPQPLLNVDFGGSLVSAKTGFAAVGQTDGDYWNGYPADSSSISNLFLADGLQTAISVSITNSLFWRWIEYTDPMLHEFVYPPHLAGPFTVQISGLPAGTYSFYLYNAGAKYWPWLGSDFELIVGGVSQGHNVLAGQIEDPPPWREGVDYGTFHNVQVTGPQQSVALVVRGNYGEDPNIAGLQIGEFLTSNAPPVFWAQPASQFVPVGTNFLLAATGSGFPSPAQQWFLNGILLTNGGRFAGADAKRLIITGAAFADTGDYYAVLTNSSGVVTSAVAHVVIGEPPALTLQPSNQIVVVGANILMAVSASGDAPLSYQWFMNGLALTDDSHRFGSTSNLLSITNAQTSDTGNYSVAVTNVFGIANSVTSVLDVVQLPSITKQPVGRSVPVGLPTIFSATASGTAPLGYLWQLNGTNLPGANSSNYTNNAVTTNDLGAYQLVVTNLGGAVTSSVALLTLGPVAAWGNNVSGQVLPPPGLSNVVALAAGSQFSLALKADGTVVAWGVGPGTNVPAGLNNVAGIAAGLTFGLGVRSDGTVVSWGSSTATNVPGSVSNVILSSGSSSHALALRREGVVFDWGSSRTPVPAGLTKVVSVADAPGFSLVARADGTVTAWGSFSSGAAPVSANPPIPLSNVVAVACGAMHAVALRSDGSVYSWGGGTTTTNVPVTLTNIIAIAAGSADQATDYTLALRTNGLVVGWGGNSLGPTNIPAGLSNVVAIAAGSTHALALVSSGAPIILGEPVGGTAFSGSRFALNASVSGQEPLTYVWSLNGTNLPNATNASYVISNAQPANAGVYALTASNALGVAVSVPAPVVVVDSAPFILTAPTGTNRPYIGSQFTLSAAVAGSGPPRLQWQFGGQNLSGQTNTDLLFARVRRTNSGNYTIVASNSFGAITSSVAGLFPTSVAAWGVSTYGVTNVPVNLTNAVAIAIDNENAAALRADGTVATWGFSGSSVPTDVSNIVEIAAGANFFIGLRTNGTACAWLASTAFSNTLASLTNIVAIEADNAAGTFLKPDGTVTRILNSGATVAFPQLSNVVALSKFYDGFAALRADGTVFTTGSGTAPPASATSNVLDIALESSYGTALRRDGTIQAWGLYPKQSTNFPGNMIAVSANAGVLSNGTVYAWMWSPNYPTLLNVPSGLANVAAVDASSTLTLALPVARDFPQGLLPDALDTTALVVSSRGAPQWFAQTTTTHDGVSAAQSADIDNNTASSMRLWVAGPVNISFWWKVSSETNHDFLSFSAGGVLLTNISGETGWQPCAILIPAGNQILQWTYSKDAAGNAGQDAGWVDQPVITPIAPSIVTQPQSQTVVGPTNVTLSVSATGTPPLKYEWSKNGGPLAGAGNASLNLLSVTRTNSGTYSLVITNLGGSITSSNAVLRVMVPEQLQLPIINPEGSVMFTFGDRDGGLLSSNDIANFNISTSTNLVQWQVLPNTLTLTNGMLRFQDFGATNYPQQFYRVIENP